MLCENFIYTGPLPVLSPGRGSVPGLAGLLGLLGLIGLAGLAVIHDRCGIRFALKNCNLNLI